MLRKYQQDALDALIATKTSAPLVVLPTGSGKTWVIAHYAKHLLEQGHNVVVATHVKELVEQNARVARELELTPSIFCAGLGKKEQGGQLTLGTVQSLSSLKLESFVLIVDEAHRVSLKSKTYGELCRRATKRVGFTATPFRLADTFFLADKAEGGAFTKIVFEAKFSELVAEGYLAPLKTTLSATQDTTGIKKSKGDFDAHALEERFSTKEAIREQVNTLAQFLPNHKKTLVFGISVAHSYALGAGLYDLGFKAAHLCGEHSPQERRTILAKFRTGEISVLTNCELLTTGFDIPDIDCVALLRPTLSKALYLQMLGRGTRAAPDKPHCQVLDFGGNLFRFGLPGDSLLEDPAKIAPCKNFKTCNNWALLKAVPICRDCKPAYEAKEKAAKALADDAIKRLELLDYQKMMAEAEPLIGLAARRHRAKSGNDCIALNYITSSGSYTVFLTFSNYWQVKQSVAPRLEELLGLFPKSIEKYAVSDLLQEIQNRINSGRCGVKNILIGKSPQGFPTIKHV